MSETAPFKLSIQLEGHTADVRSVSATYLTDSLDTLLLTASRDGTAKVWTRPPGARSKRDISCRNSLEGHEGFVNSCSWLKQDGRALAITGGQDKMINAYDISTGEASSSGSSMLPDYTLIGHEDNVCALDVYEDKEGYIVSGSWDRTARVWRNWECVAILSGHTQAVWAVLALTEDLVLTASADKLIRLYSIKRAAGQGSESTPIATFSGHNDAVRGLVRISESSFASCSNDGNIHIYPIPQSLGIKSAIHPAQTLSGHTSFVYSLALLSDGSLASSGEDRSVRIWRDGVLRQTVTIPAISVWSVAGLGNGDFACASSDGVVRIFTRVAQRVAEEEVLAVYDSAVSSQALNKTQVGDVQKENLPGAEELREPGKEGQVKMIKSGELVEAYQYSTASNKWEKIGEVVGGVGSGQKKLYQGKEYDYVFDVDIADGVPPLKLPYNATENPFNAAQRFLEKNDLPLTYLDQVVAFIEKNTEAVNLGANNDFVDPYTGASSYRPGAPSSVPSFANSASKAPSTSQSASTSTILPQRIPLTFKQFNEQGARAKIAELNGQLSSTIAMTSEESNVVEQLLPTLTAISTGKVVDSSSIDLSGLEGIILRWPLSHRFPLLDIYRLACACKVKSTTEPYMFALQAADWSQPTTSGTDDAKIRGTLSLLALRAIANTLSTSSSSATKKIATELQQGNQIQALTKPARVALATVLFNMSTHVVAGKTSDAGSIFEVLNVILENEEASSRRDGEVIYRCLVAFGNLLIGPSSGSLPVGLVTTVKASAEACATLSGEARAKTLFAEIQRASSI